jgi:hypothetical protein
MMGSSSVVVRGTMSVVEREYVCRLSSVALSSRRSGMPEYFWPSVGGPGTEDMIAANYHEILIANRMKSKVLVVRAEVLT